MLSKRLEGREGRGERGEGRGERGEGRGKGGYGTRKELGGYREVHFLFPQFTWCPLAQLSVT